MGRRMRTCAAILGLAALATLGMAGPASATYHEMKIRAFFKGPADASFIELQMYEAGQNHTAGKKVNFYDHTGALVHSSPPAGMTDVVGGDNQRTILIGDTAAGGSPDFTDPLLYQTFNSDTSGVVCYENIDCVAYGSGFNPGVLASLPSPVGTPLSGLSTNQVIARGIGRGCPTALDPADDTNDNASDFSFVVGFPLRNNSVMPTETVCPPTPSSTATTTTKRCNKKKKHRSAEVAKKKKCKKKKKR